MEINSEIARFWKWFGKWEPRLSSMSAQSIVNEVQLQIRRIDCGISVEVNDEISGRELIITAHGNTALFPLVREIVTHKPAGISWHIVALKPGSGFAFKFKTADVAIDASRIQFDPLRAKEDRGATLGIRVFLPIEDFPELDWPHIARMIVTWGEGEESVNMINHIEVTDVRTTQADLLCLSELPSYIEWWKGRGGGRESAALEFE